MTQIRLRHVTLRERESEEEVDLDEVLEMLDLSTAQGDASTDYVSEEFCEM